MSRFTAQRSLDSADKRIEGHYVDNIAQVCEYRLSYHKDERLDVSEWRKSPIHAVVSTLYSLLKALLCYIVGYKMFKTTYGFDNFTQKLEYAK